MWISKDRYKKLLATDENIEHIAFREGEGGKVEFWDAIEPEKEKYDLNL